jgi:hypothetical protein
MRVVRGLLAFVFFIVTVAVVASVLGLYLGVTGRSMPMLRFIAAQVSRLVDGQQVEQIDLRVQLRPSARDLHAAARLSVRATQAERRQVYFALRDGFTIDRVWYEKPDGSAEALEWHRLWLVTAVVLPRTLADGEQIRIGIEYGGDPRASTLPLGSGFIGADETVLNADDFWYPTDLQSFFQASVEITAPASLGIVHNGNEVSRERYGDSETVRWTTSRPVAGVAIVAGRFRGTAGVVEGRRQRVLLPEDSDLDGQRVVAEMSDSDRTLSQLFGPSGFIQTTLFVSRGLARGFHDGSGLIGLPVGAFRHGDYGLRAIAHEAAHGWWGATVGVKWLEPGSGSQWIAEGFATLSSWLVARATLGEAALQRALEQSFFDPARAGTLQSMTALDNAFDPATRETIYNKGGYAAYMLEQLVGEEAFLSAMRQIVDRFRLQRATLDDVQKVFAETAKTDLDPFWTAWLRSDATLDLSLDPKDGGVTVHNYGTAPAPAPVDLWRFVTNEEPVRQTIAPDGNTPVGNVERLVLDPSARGADMYRHNNVFPRRQNPRAVAVSARGELAVTYGETHAWAPASIVHLDARGQTLHTWEVERGIASTPAWSSDGTRLLVVASGRGGPPDLLGFNAGDGSQQRIGHDAFVTALPDGIVTALGPRLVRTAGGKRTTLAHHVRVCIDAPLASPQGDSIAYAAVSEREMELRLVGADGREPRLLLSTRPSELKWQWAPDGSRLFAVIAGDWDWQLWELPLDGPPRALAREAAAMPALAVAPDGQRLAVIAAPTVDFAGERREVFIIDRSTGHSDVFNLGGRNAHDVAWLGGDALLVVVSDPTYRTVPAQREL